MATPRLAMFSAAWAYRIMVPGWGAVWTLAGKRVADCAIHVTNRDGINFALRAAPEFGIVAVQDGHVRGMPWVPAANSTAVHFLLAPPA
jgi:hypothetical protein